MPRSSTSNRDGAAARGLASRTVDPASSIGAGPSRVDAVRKEPVVTEGGTVEPRSVLRVVLSVDHRPIDGVVAAEWMRAFLGLLTDPIRILA